MSFIFGWPAKAAAGVIARERAVAEADSQRRRPRRRGLRAGLCALLVAAAALVTSPARGQSITTTVPDDNQPHGIAINPVTNKIYFADYGSGTLTVVDGATNAVSTVSYGGFSNWAVVVNPVTNFVYVVDRGLNTIDVFTGATATAPAQFVKTISPGSGNLYAIAVNPVTNMVYVADDGNIRVIVINGSTNTETTTIPLGGLNAPVSIAVNPATNMIYTADNNSNNVSVINGSNNTLAATVGVGSSPFSLAVNPATNKIYVANMGSNNVSVIDGSTDAVTTVQDGQASSPLAVAVNPETNQVYVANGSGNATIINVANNNAVTDVPTLAGTSTFMSVAVDTSSNQAYVANSGNGTVTIINGNTLAVTTQLTAQAQTAEIAVNPVTHKVYAADYTSGGLVPITVIDGATNTVQPLTPPNQAPAVVAVNPVTNLIYVANSASNNVSVIDGSTNTLLTTVAVDANPAAIVVDPVNNLVYVANSGGGDITVIDSAFNTSTITFSQALSPNELAFNPVLNMVYGATSQASGLAFQFFSQDGPQTITPNTLFVGTDITAVAVNPAQGYNVYVVATTPGIQVFDSHGGFTTSTCNASVAPTAMDVNATTNVIYVTCADGSVNIYQQPDSFESGNLVTLVPTGAVSGAAVAVNAVTNMAYVADSGSSSVYVINGASPATVTIPIVSASSNPITPVAIAVNVATNKIYVVSQGNPSNTPNVTIIDGATNTVLGMIQLTSPGAFTGEIAANPVTGNIYALDSTANAIDVITENAVLPNALQTTINPLPSIGGLPPNSTNTTSPAFTFSATNGLTSAPVTGVYYQVDTQQGQWSAAITSGGGNFSGAASGITPGFHILYAYATDGEDGAAGNSGAYSAQNGPLVGAIASYGFLVSPPIATINFYPLNFGNIPVGGMSPSPYPILINEGGSPMTYSYTITGPNASEFIVNPSLSSCAASGTLSANSACEIYVTFQPTTTGLATATLTWTDDSLGISNSMQSIGFAGNNATAFSNLTPSQSIPAGTNSINLSGTISATAGSYPPSGETVGIIINSITQNATIGANGAFSTAFNTSAIPSSPTPYTITYYYQGDAYYLYASNNSTTLTVTSAVVVPTPTPTEEAANPSYTTTSAFSFMDTEAGVTFKCSLDSAPYTPCLPGVTYSGLSEGPHTWSVEAVDASANVSAPFTDSWTIVPSQVTVIPAGTGGGSVTSSPTGISCPSTCVAPFDGVTVTLTATPNAGSVFTGWSVVGGSCPGTGTCTVNTASAFQSVTATFTLLTSFTLSVTELGTGTGQVTYGPPPQFTCSEANGLPETGTCSASYTSGTPVTLTATPTAPTTFGGWGGACASSGTTLTCNLTITSSENVTANFVPAPKSVLLSFPVGTNPPPQEAIFDCPSNTNPCTDPSAHALQLTIPNVSATVAVTVLATEVPPSQADGLCESGNTVLNDFDCRFVTFFSDGTDANSNVIVPLCDPYANGNCVHYLVYSTSGGPGVEPPASSYSGGVYWQITWNNESFTPPAPYWSGSTPQLYDDPDYPVSQTAPYGTNCSPSTPMLVGITNPQDTNPLIYCQFEFNITQFYNPTQTVDSGIGGSTKQFNDVVVAFPPTVAGTNPVVQPPTPSTPAIAVTCLTGCSITGTTINFTVGTGGTFQAVPTGYPASTLTESGALPNGLTINMLTGIVGGTPAPGSNGTYTIMFTATNSVNHVTQTYTLIVSPPAPPPTYTVTVTEQGNGQGAVTASPINCGENNGIPDPGNVCSASFTAGTMVTLTATATSPSSFAFWGGACASFTTSTTCTLTVNSSENVTANFLSAPAAVPLSFPVGSNPPPQEAVFNCPSNTNPCTDPSAHALQLTIPNVNSTVNVTVLATEVPPSQANGLCGSTNTVLNNFDCRFVTFFSDGTDANNNTIVPLCDPYANGNCVHYLVYSTSGGPGVEPPASSYSGGVYWQITWNNESFTPPAPYWSGSTPQLYDDPDYAVSPTSAVGTSCTQPMTINGVNQSYSCQYEFNITEFYNPLQTVDSGIGGSTKQFNDVVVAFPPTVAGTGTIVQPPPTPNAPAITAACLTGCSIAGTTINFTIGSGGTFQALPTGYPAPTLTETGALPSGLTINMLTGIVGGTPAPGTSGSFTISFTATNSSGHVTQSYTLTVSDASQTITFPTSPASAVYNTTFTATATSSSGLPVTIAATGVCTISGSTVTMTSGTGTCTLTASQAGNGSFSPATSVVHNVAATMATQTITFPASPTSAVYNSTFTATATSSSGLTVTIAATGVCTISSGTVTMTSGTGTCTLTASQIGNSNFGPATSVVHNVAAAMASQTITFPASPTSAVYNTTFTATATSSSGLTVTIAATGVCTISSSTVTMTSGTGTCTLTASQAGNGNFSAATNVVHNVAAALATQTITFTGAPASAAFGSSFTVAASASSGLAVTVTSSGACTNSGAVVTITAGSGTCSLLASQSGNTNYSAAASKTQSTSATKAGSTTTITSNTPNPSTVNQAVTIAFKVTGSGTPTGTVTVTASTGGSCSGTLSSGAGSCTITFTSPASATLTAAYSGDGNFTGSTSASVSQTVNAISSTLKISPTSLNFGTVYYDQIGVQFVTLTNTGTTPIAISSVKITTPGNAIADFGEITVCLPFIPSMPGTLAAGKTCTIAVGFLDASKIFSPTASTATIAITDNAAGSPQLIPLSLTVINPQASLSASSLSFATQKVGTTSAAKTVTLTNTGNTPLTLGTLTISGNFALVSGSGTTCSNNGTVAAGASCTMNVTFKPTAKGNNTGSVKITDNALSSPQSISLSGTGD
jgi:YVTN family beta-propeller protein